MAKKFAIGLNYFFDNQSNSGIVNYVFNIIAALNTLPDDEKPKIVVFYSTNAPIDYLKSIEYPFIEYILFNQYPSNIIARKANALIRKLFKRDIYKQFKYFNNINSLYPYFETYDYAFADFKNKIYWLVDFNNRAFPLHYADKGENMLSLQRKITNSTQTVVLSSNALFDELKQYYPDFKCTIKVMRFASSLPSFNEEDVTKTQKNYNITQPYLMSPNQLWEHKNQSLVLEALNIIRQKEPLLKFKTLFSGSLEVNRGKGLYIDLLKQKIKEYNLEDFVSFMGVLDRGDQLLLMKGCSALIQPSLYEGWSTLVEEAKALNKFIILSDLPVHKEQITENVTFFDPSNASELAEKIIAQLKRPANIVKTDYSENIKKYGREILSALTDNRSIA